jgi:hypothetical protein
MGEWKRDRNSTEPDREGYVRALKRELAGYVANGDEARASAVRAELERVTAGGEPARADRGPVERAVPEPVETAEPVKSKPARPRKATARKTATKG